MRMVSAFFSMLMPGVGQMYNGHFLKGVILLAIEHYDNVFGHINRAIHLDFNGHHQKALQALDFQSAMFYPGFYVYVIWDAYYYAKPNGDKRAAIPFVIAGFGGEIASIFASHLPFPTLTIGLIMLVPIILAMICYRILKAE